MDDPISRHATIDAIESTDWYHIEGGELVHGANSKEDEPLYKAKDIYSVIENLPPAQPEIIQCKDCKFSHMTINGECKYCDIWFPDEKCYMSGDYYCGSAERR